MWELMPIIIWLIAGALTLPMKEIPKISYGIMWFCLMFELTINYME